MLAVEVRQYQAGDDGLRAVVPRLIGATAAAQARKERTPGAQRQSPWTVEEVLENLRSRLPDDAWAAERIVDWARTREGIKLTGGRGPNYPAVVVTYDTLRTKGPRERAIFMVQGGPNLEGVVEVRLRRMWTTPPYRSAQGKQRFFDMVRSVGIPQLSSGIEVLETRPNIPLTDLNEEQVGNC